MARGFEPEAVDVFVGARLSRFRTDRELTQAALARSIGVSFQQLQKYETGRNRISASRLHRAAGVLGVPVEAFFPPAPSPGGDPWAALRTSGVEALELAQGYARIEPADVRRAVARIVTALAST